MKNKNSLWFIAAIAYTLLFQSCTKDNPYLHNQITQDKLLLSKITGSVSSQSSYFYYGAFNNSYTYNWIGQLNNFGSYDSGIFQINYSYKDNHKGWDDYKPVSQESFINTGHYDFSYNGFFPDKVADNSYPGQDQGYWKFYYNSFDQVQKVGSAFSSTTDPVEWEFYTRDNKGLITGFVYGKVIDTFNLKVQYKYDEGGNLSGYEVYLPYYLYSGYPANRNSGEGSKQTNTFTEAKHQLINKKLSLLPQPVPGATDRSLNSSLSSAADTIPYYLYYTAIITTDHRINPFSQQGNIFYYEANRYYYLYDPTPFYISLLKSNPVNITYQIYIGYPTPLGSAVQTFSYTYNKAGYPVSVHEIFNDGDEVFHGSYTRDSKIEYIKND